MQRCNLHQNTHQIHVHVCLDGGTTQKRYMHNMQRDIEKTATSGPPLLAAAAAHTSQPILEIGNDADGLL